MNQLSGKVALVTGGSRGIGAAAARRLARGGAAVALTYVTAADKAQAVAKQIDADGGRVLVIQADNADPGAVMWEVIGAGIAQSDAIVVQGNCRGQAARNEA
jgi:3-oxoacyl-[acyl-carrier protein] reductase